jgi:hypothetical protein
MHWYEYVAYFFGGMFLANAVPHFVSGVMGRRFPTPFASPPGKGESLPVVNVLWGACNVVIGYLLVFRVGEFSVRETSSVVALGVGGLVMGVMLSRTFGRVYGGNRGDWRNRNGAAQMAQDKWRGTNGTAQLAH